MSQSGPQKDFSAWPPALHAARFPAPSSFCHRHEPIDDTRRAQIPDTALQ
jgi:hypothetical protein